MSEPIDVDNDDEAFAENTLTQAIENQIESDNPPAAKATYNKLTLVGYERDDILNMMAHVLAVEIDAILEEDRAFNTEWYEAALRALPEFRPRRTEAAQGSGVNLRRSLPVQLMGRHRPAKPVTLPQVTVKVEQELRLLDVFNPLRMHLQAHALGQRNDRANDGHIVIVLRQSGNKTLIDLELLNRQPL